MYAGLVNIRNHTVVMVKFNKIKVFRRQWTQTRKPKFEKNQVNWITKKFVTISLK